MKSIHETTDRGSQQGLPLDELPSSSNRLSLAGYSPVEPVSVLPVNFKLPFRLTRLYTIEHRTIVAMKQRSNRKDNIMKKRYTYLGVDAHSDMCQLAAMSQDSVVLSCKSYPTSAVELIEAVAAVKGRKKLVVEESQMADWVKRTLEPYVDECVIADPKTNAWISKSKEMNDKIAATRLAKLYIGGYIKPVYHPDLKRQQFKELVLHYHDVTRQVTRFKNKLKGEFIAKAVDIKGTTVYNSEIFPEYLKELKGHPNTQYQAKDYFNIIQILEKSKDRVMKKIESSGKLYPEIKQLSKMPGIGPVSAFTISAIVDTPHRFSNKKKFWSYCCLVKSQKTSNGKIYGSGSNNQGNHLLKHIFIQAAKTIISSNEDSRFKNTADHLLAQGVSVKNTRRTIARQLASVILTIWRSGEPYRYIN
jgi:transposase